MQEKAEDSIQSPVECSTTYTQLEFTPSQTSSSKPKPAEKTVYSQVEFRKDARELTGKAGEKMPAAENRVVIVKDKEVRKEEKQPTGDDQPKPSALKKTTEADQKPLVRCFCHTCISLE